MIELYAITDHPSPPLPATSPLTAVEAGRLSAVCGPAAGTEPSPEDLWRREAMVEELMEDRDLLPARYGSVFDDEAGAARAVLGREDDLLAALARVRGAVELSLRVHEAGARPAEPASGTDWIRVKTEHEARRREVVDAVHEPLLALARDGVTLPSRPGAEVLRAAYLVERDGVKPFAARVAELQQGAPDLRLLCTGPWPAYSFSAS